jgi:uncharacterized protein YkwD
MKTHISLKVIAVVFGAALSSCAPQPQPTKIKVSASARPESSLSGQVFQEVNSYRGQRGAAALQRHAGLDRLAQAHCEYLRQHRGSFKLYGKNVSHFGFDGRTLAARERYQMQNISENVVAANHPGKNPAPVIVNLWAGSKNHEFNMRQSWTHTGVGVVTDSDGMVFATQLFATVSNSQLATRERFNRF